MKLFRLFSAFALFHVFSTLLLLADATIGVPASAITTGQPGDNPPAFTFTTATDGPITIKAMFMTHWLTNRTNVVSNPKAIAFMIDGAHFPSATGSEDFYGYLDRSLWPERAASRDQQVWIEETLFLPRGSHTIQFRNGLMERDDSGFRPRYSYGSWMTASITIPAPSRDLTISVMLVPNTPSISISPPAQSILAGQPAILSLTSSGASNAQLIISDGNVIANPTSPVSLSLLQGTHNFNYVAAGEVRVSWRVFDGEQIWIDPPSGDPINVSSLFDYTARLSGDYVLRAIAGGVTKSQSFHVDLPTVSASATLTVTADSGLSVGPRVTEFSPVAASVTSKDGVTAGHSYGRSWNSDGAWTAYLGRDGVGLRVVGQSSESSINNFEVQAKSPSGEWYLLTSGSPNTDINHGVGVAVAQTFSVRLGDVDPVKPLLPADPTLVGTWTLRARISDATGAWSPWSFEQPLNVVYPVKATTVIGQTLPPVVESDWFTASPQQNYTYQVLVP